MCGISRSGVGDARYEETRVIHDGRCRRSRALPRDLACPAHGGQGSISSTVSVPAVRRNGLAISCIPAMTTDSDRTHSSSRDIRASARAAAVAERNFSRAAAYGADEFRRGDVTDRIGAILPRLFLVSIKRSEAGGSYVALGHSYGMPRCVTVALAEREEGPCPDPRAEFKN